MMGNAATTPVWNRLGSGKEAHNRPAALVGLEAEQACQQQIGENGDEKRIIPQTRLSTRIGLCHDRKSGKFAPRQRTPVTVK